VHHIARSPHHKNRKKLNNFSAIAQHYSCCHFNKFVCVCVCVCVYIYIYIHIHTLTPPAELATKLRTCLCQKCVKLHLLQCMSSYHILLLIYLLSWDCVWMLIRSEVWIGSICLNSVVLSSDPPGSLDVITCVWNKNPGSVHQRLHLTCHYVKDETGHCVISQMWKA